MTEPKFTPGPWAVSVEQDQHDGHAITRFYICGAEQQTTIERPDEIQITAGYGGLSDGFASIEKARANVQLLGAALELFEALRLLIEKGVKQSTGLSWSKRLHMARATLAKATDIN